MNNSDIFLIILCASVLLILASVVYFSIKENQARDEAESTISESNIKKKYSIKQYYRLVWLTLRGLSLIALAAHFHEDATKWLFGALGINATEMMNTIAFGIVFYGVSGFAILTVGREAKRLEELKK
ncbi:hypothetical protein [uncultured Deefgea sp.]|uniref:hypothetical protein n=1 Tax=uncultured Deefgea sp. TaxID=1304914 RepID=UPI002594C234|nr:hypothetical protein [uncultured Deefgea sp.]